jgi:hypothetical protein
LDRQQQVNEAGALVARYLGARGDGDRLLAALGKALLREDRNFHTIQTVEAAFRQFADLRGSPEGAHVLVAAARYLAAHAPTVRAQGQTYQFAVRLNRGERLYEETEDAGISMSVVGDLDGMELGRNRDVQIPMIGDSKSVLRQCLRIAKKTSHSAWTAKVRAVEEKSVKRQREREASNAVPITHFRFARAVADAIDDRAGVVPGDGLLDLAFEPESLLEVERIVFHGPLCISAGGRPTCEFRREFGAIFGALRHIRVP